MLEIRGTKEGLLIPVKLQPRAARTEICGCFGESLKIRVVSPPLEGRANQECIKYLSGLMGVSKSSLKLVSGEKSREKQILLPWTAKDTLERILKSLAIDYRLS